MKITFFNHSEITKLLVSTDKVCARLPFISTVNSIKNIFLKHCVFPLLNFLHLVEKKTFWQNYYISHILNQKLQRNLWLLIPVVGNAYVYYCDAKKAPVADDEEDLLSETLETATPSEKLEIATILAAKDPASALDKLNKFDVSKESPDTHYKKKVKLARVLAEKDLGGFLNKVDDFKLEDIDKSTLAKTARPKNAEVADKVFESLSISEPKIQWDLLVVYITEAKKLYDKAVASGTGVDQAKADLDSLVQSAVTVIAKLKKGVFVLSKDDNILKIKKLDQEIYYRILAAFIEKHKLALSALPIDNVEILNLAPHLTYLNLTDANARNVHNYTEEFLGNLLEKASNLTHLVIKNSNMSGECLDKIPNMGQLKRLEVDRCSEFNRELPDAMDGLEELTILNCSKYDQPLPKNREKLQKLSIALNDNLKEEDLLNFFVEIYQKDKPRAIGLADAYYEAIQGPTHELRSQKNILCHIFTGKNPAQAEAIKKWFAKCPDALVPALEKAETPFVKDAELANDPLQQLYIYAIYAKAETDFTPVMKQLLGFLIRTPMDADLEAVYESIYMRSPEWHRGFLTFLNESSFFTTVDLEQRHQFFPYLARIDSGWTHALTNMQKLKQDEQFSRFAEAFPPTSGKANIITKENLFSGDLSKDAIILDILQVWPFERGQNINVYKLLDKLPELLKDLPEAHRKAYLPYLMIADSGWDVMLQNMKNLDKTHIRFEIFPEEPSANSTKWLSIPGLFEGTVENEDFDFIRIVTRFFNDPNAPKLLQQKLQSLREIKREFRETVFSYLIMQPDGSKQILDNLRNLIRSGRLNNFTDQFPASAKVAGLLTKEGLFSGNVEGDIRSEMILKAATSQTINDLERVDIKKLLTLIEKISLQSLPSYLPYLLLSTRSWEAKITNLRNLEACGQLVPFVQTYDINTACRILETKELFVNDADTNSITFTYITEIDQRGILILRDHNEDGLENFISTPQGRLLAVLKPLDILSVNAYASIVMKVYPPTDPDNHSLYPIGVHKRGREVYINFAPTLPLVGPDLFLEALEGCEGFTRLRVALFGSPAIDAGGPGRQFISQLFLGFVNNSRLTPFVKSDDTLPMPALNFINRCTPEKKKNFKRLGNLMGFALRLHYPTGEVFNTRWLNLIRSFTTQQLEAPEFSVKTFFDSLSNNQLITFLRNSTIYEKKLSADFDRALLGKNPAISLKAAENLNKPIEEGGLFENDETLNQAIANKDIRKIREVIRELLFDDLKDYIEASHATAQGLKEALPLTLHDGTQIKKWDDMKNVASTKLALSLQGSVNLDDILNNLRYEIRVSPLNLAQATTTAQNMKLWVEKWLKMNKNNRDVLGNFVQLFSGSRAISGEIKFMILEAPGLQDLNFHTCFHFADVPLGVTEEALKIKLDTECKSNKSGEAGFTRL